MSTKTNTNAPLSFHPVLFDLSFNPLDDEKMSASRLRSLIADRGPAISSADFAANRRRQPVKEKRKRRQESDEDEYQERKSDDDDDDDALSRISSLSSSSRQWQRQRVAVPNTPGRSSAEKARERADIVQFDVMDDGDWSDEMVGKDAPVAKHDPRTVRKGDDVLAQAQVDALMHKGDKDAIMDAYLQERMARVAMDRQQAERDAMDIEDSPAAAGDTDVVMDDCEALFARMRMIAEGERADAVARQRIHTRVQLATDKLVGADVRQGDVRLAKIRKCLTDMGYTRSQFQELFHNKFIQACLPQ